MESLSVKERAEKLVLSLDPNVPVVVRYMRPSHVSGCFMMALSKAFCEKFMSKTDLTMTLIDEQGEEFDKVIYLVERTALSGGWKGFAIAHGIRPGDAVLFQLIDAERFKIYIVRKDCGEADDIDGDAGKNMKRKKTSTVTKPTAKRQRRAVAKGNAGEKMKFAAKWCLPLDIFEESLIVTELPDKVKEKYYLLCCSQKSLLHINLVRSGDRKSVTGIITETVAIADAIRAFRPSDTTKDEWIARKTRLEEFHKLGMDVAFMIPRINEFLKLIFVSKTEAIDSKKLREFAAKQARAERALDLKILDSRDALKRVEYNISTMEALEQSKFEAKMKAPW